MTGRREAVVKVLNVSTADGFRMPSLDARVTISIAGDDNFRDFKKAVDRDGYAFVGRVETMVAHLGRADRPAATGRTEPSIPVRMALADLFRDVLDVRLADGLLALHSMDEIVCEWDPKFIQVYDVARETAAVKAKGAVAMAKEETKAEVMVARIRSLTPIAEALGQPVDWLPTPAAPGRRAPGVRTRSYRDGEPGGDASLPGAAVHGPGDHPGRDPDGDAVDLAHACCLRRRWTPPHRAAAHHERRPSVSGPGAHGRCGCVAQLVRDETLVSIWEHCGGDSQGLHGIAAVNRGRANCDRRDRRPAAGRGVHRAPPGHRPVGRGRAGGAQPHRAVHAEGSRLPRQRLSDEPAVLREQRGDDPRRHGADPRRTPAPQDPARLA
ncbi:MAG: hypothetical protein R2705_20810 [Ilumatobacteraceae bacterium]